MLCRRSQTISKRSTPQPSLRLSARDRGSACHMQSEWKIKTETKTKRKRRRQRRRQRRWPAECRPVVAAPWPGCVQTAGHFHLVMVMVTAWIRDLGACRVGCYRISIARIPSSRKSLFILCNLLWNLNLKMKTDPERKRWRQRRRRTHI